MSGSKDLILIKLTGFPSQNSSTHCMGGKAYLYKPDTVFSGWVHSPFIKVRRGYISGFTIPQIDYALSTYLQRKKVFIYFNVHICMFSATNETFM